MINSHCNDIWNSFSFIKTGNDTAVAFMNSQLPQHLTDIIYQTKTRKSIFQWLLKGALSVFKIIIANFCRYITELFKFSYHGYSINGVDTCNKKLDINFCSNIYELQNISLLHDCLFQVKKIPQLFHNFRCYQMLSNSHLWLAHHWI